MRNVSILLFSHLHHLLSFFYSVSLSCRVSHPSPKLPSVAAHKKVGNWCCAISLQHQSRVKIRQLFHNLYYRPTSWKNTEVQNSGNSVVGTAMIIASLQEGGISPFWRAQVHAVCSLGTICS